MPANVALCGSVIRLVGLFHYQKAFPRAETTHFFVVRRGQPMEGAPIVGSAVETLAGNPATVCGKHIDIINGLIKIGILEQWGEGASTIGAESQVSILGSGPHRSSLAAPNGVEPLIPSFADVIYRIPQPAASCSSFEITTPHIAHNDRRVAVEGNDILEGFTLVAKQFSLFQDVPRRMDVVGTVDFPTFGRHPKRAVGGHRGVCDDPVATHHIEFPQPVALLRPPYLQKGQQKRQKHNRFFHVIITRMKVTTNCHIFAPRSILVRSPYNAKSTNNAAKLHFKFLFIYDKRKIIMSNPDIVFCNPMH